MRLPQLKVSALLLLTALHCIGGDESVAQNGETAILAQAVSDDTLAQDEWNEEAYYHIGLLRLERWIRDNVDQLDDPALVDEVTGLKKEMETFADSGDYIMANLWLEIIWGLLLPKEPISAFEATDGNPGFSEDPIKEDDKRFSWSRELSTGVDFWRHEFNFSFLQSDSTFLEGSGNPSTGLRINFDYGNGFQNVLQGYAFFKYSRDYLTGEADLRYTHPLSDRSHWRIENRFEGNSFYRDFDLQYWQNSSALAFKINETKAVVFDIEDEFLLRRYDNEDSTYSNYYHNTFEIDSRLNFSSNLYLGLGFGNIQRLHPTHEVKDYHENRFEATLVHRIGRAFNISLEHELRLRNYTNAPDDTTFQDYNEHYLSGEVVIGFTRTVGLQTEGSLIIRDYEFVDENSLPGYTFWEINPEVYLNLGEDWKISAGVYYGEQTHENLATRITSTDALSVSSFLFEDYFRYGPTFAVELFQIDGLILTVQESYLMERYPKSQTGSISDFNLFSDRNINSLLLFLSWSVSHRWRLNVFANNDDDRSLKDDSGDSRNTLVGLEVGYTF